MTCSTPGIDATCSTRSTPGADDADHGALLSDHDVGLEAVLLDGLLDVLDLRAGRAGPHHHDHPAHRPVQSPGKQKRRGLAAPASAGTTASAAELCSAASYPLGVKPIVLSHSAADDTGVRALVNGRGCARCGPVVRGQGPGPCVERPCAMPQAGRPRYLDDHAPQATGSRLATPGSMTFRRSRVEMPDLRRARAGCVRGAVQSSRIGFRRTSDPRVGMAGSDSDDGAGSRRSCRVQSHGS